MAATFEVGILRGRTETVDLTLVQGDGSTGTSIATGDIVRAKLYRRDDQVPDLDIRSGSATANGSVITHLTAIPTPVDTSAQVRIKFAQGDTDGLLPGAYTLEVFVVDDSETSPADAALGGAIGTLHLLSSAGGDIDS